MFIKRKSVCGICTASLWWLPIMVYISLKIMQSINEPYEWVWWVGMPTMFLVWVLINWKIKIKDDDNI